MSDRGPGTGIVGARVPRIESRSKVTGSVRYIADLTASHMLHGRLVRSPFPHAIVRSIDAEAALEIPGVVRVIWAADVEAAWPEMTPYDLACKKLDRDPDRPILPGDPQLLDRHVRFVGEAVALVLAEDQKAARDAAELIHVDYEQLESVLDTAAALDPSAPQLHEGAPANVATRMTRQKGDIELAFRSAALIVERRFETQRQKHAQLEPTACLAIPEPDGRVTVWTPSQSPHRARITLAGLFGLPVNAVRVVVPPIGGAFGKGDALTIEPYATAGALLTGRPVRILLSRQEDFVATESRHATVTTLAGAFAADGSLLGLRSHTVVDSGAYLSHSLSITGVLLGQLLAPYPVAAADLSAEVVFTSTPTSGAFRGYGGPQAAFPLEHLIDLACAELGVDPVEARRRMHVRVGDLYGYGQQPLERESFEACLDAGRRAIDWDRKRVAPTVDGPRRRGVGMAAVTWKSGVVGKGIDHSGADVRWAPDGTVHLLTGASDLGTGIRTTLAQICAEVMGVPFAAIQVAPTDTDVTPYDSGAFASRSLFRNGQAVERAARLARDDLLEYAADLMEIDARDLEIRDGLVVAAGAPHRSMTLPAVLRRGLMDGREFHGSGLAPLTTGPTFAAQFAEVEVDIETGRVEIVRIVAVQDVGRAINPTIVEGQMQGAVHQGIGYALTEGLVLDPDTGALLNGTFMDYRVLTSSDSPPIETILIEDPDPSGPFGAKGVGEASIVITAPAIANAIFHATGASVRRLPMTPERVLAAFLDQTDPGR